MSEFVVAVFDDRDRAYEGVQALDELHEQGNATVYGTVVLARDAHGVVSIKQPIGGKPLGTAAGALGGVLIGALGGPAGAAIGAAVGALAGRLGDYLHAEGSTMFIKTMERELPPGKFAVLAEISEEWCPSIDGRMEALGGKVVHRWRQDAIDEFATRKAKADTMTLAQLKQERAGVKARQQEARLAGRIEHDARALQKTADKARVQLDEAKEVLSAKLDVLAEQATHATPEIRNRIEQRISKLRNDFARRETELRRAVELAEEALH